MTPLARNLAEFAPRWQSLLVDAKTDLYEQAAKKPLNLNGYLGALDLVAALDRIIAHQDGLAEVECPDCEWTPSGHFAYPCTAHGCPTCAHLTHSSGECGAPDPLTGWCECLYGPALAS